MPWIDITAPEIGDATKKVSFADAVIGNLVFLHANMGGSSGGGGGALITNGNFELDGDSDGIPDGWDLTEYTAGAFALDTSTPGEGATGIKFTSPGASGGGDLQSTDFFPVGPGKILVVGFVHWASVAGIHNVVEIRWYSTALEANYISTSTLYDSTDNPTTITPFTLAATPPATARFAKLKLIGALNDTATAGIAYFDDVSVRPFDGNLQSSGTIAEGSAYHSAYADDASFVLPVGSLSADCVLRLHFVAELKTATAGGGYIAHQRFRVGSAFSNEVESTSTTYEKNHFTLDVPIGTSGAITVYLQTWHEVGSVLTYWKKPDPDVMIEVLVP